MRAVWWSVLTVGALGIGVALSAPSLVAPWDARAFAIGGALATLSGALLALKPAGTPRLLPVAYISVLAVALRAQFAGLGLYGLDPWYELAFLVGFVGPANETTSEVPLFLQSIENFQLLHTLSYVLASFGGVKLASVAVALPLLFTPVVLAGVGLTVRAFVCSLRSPVPRIPSLARRGAVNIAVYSLTVTYGFFMFHSLFIRESLAMLYGVLLVWTIAAARRSVSMVIASVIFLMAVVGAHHLTPLVFVILLLLAAASEILIGGRPSLLARLTLVLAAAMIGYWLYLDQSPIVLLVEGLRQLLGESTDFGLAGNYTVGRYSLLLRAQQVLTLLIGVLSSIALISALRMRGAHLLSGIALTGAFLGAIAVASLFLPNNSIGPQRFELFGLYFVLMAAAVGYAVLSAVLRTARWFGPLVAILFSAWAMLNLYRVPTAVYTNDIREVAVSSPRPWLLDSEEAALTLYASKSSSGANVWADWELGRILRTITLRDQAGELRGALPVAIDDVTPGDLVVVRLRNVVDPDLGELDGVVVTTATTSIGWR